MYNITRIKSIQRPWGLECRFTAISPGDPDLNEVVLIRDGETALQSAERRLAVLIARLDAEAAVESVRSRIFDELGPEIKEAITWLIVQIRKYPSATVAQAETQWNATWADSLFTFTKLATWVQARTGGVTWNQFKTYVINHHFNFIDGEI